MEGAPELREGPARAQIRVGGRRDGVFEPGAEASEGSGVGAPNSTTVTPAKAGVQLPYYQQAKRPIWTGGRSWVTAFAGMTTENSLASSLTQQRHPRLAVNFVGMDREPGDFDDLIALRFDTDPGRRPDPPQPRKPVESHRAGTAAVGRVHQHNVEGHSDRPQRHYRLRADVGGRPKLGDIRAQGIARRLVVLHEDASRRAARQRLQP